MVKASRSSRRDMKTMYTVGWHRDDWSSVDVDEDVDEVMVVVFDEPFVVFVIVVVVATFNRL